MADFVRKTAVLTLMNIEKNGAYINIEMNKLRSSDKLSAHDCRFIGEIVNGVIKYKITIDYVISLHSKTTLKKISPYILSVLRCGIYQILFMDKIPDSAAVNESVKLVKNSSVKRLSGFVNAVLRAVSRKDIDSLVEDTADALSVKYSFPVWLVNRWVNTHGFDFTIKLMKTLNQHSPLYIRCNCLKTSLPQLERLMKDNDIQYEPFVAEGFKGFKTCYKISNTKSLNDMNIFNNGMFYIQDPAAALAAYIASPKPGDTVIDMCSAPGGKSLYMAELMNDNGCIFSCDIYDHKIKLIEANTQKYGFSIIKPQISDATVFKKEFEGIADCVLCDVPCSGFGIIRKKPDIKYSRSESDIEELAALSLKILNNASKYLKKGGTLVFSTCTIESAENEYVCDKFLAMNHDFKFSSFGDDERFSSGYKTFYPHIDGTDGFFVAKFIKAE